MAEADLGLHIEIARLEWELCEAAVSLREEQQAFWKLHPEAMPYFEAQARFNLATDALIAARKKIETEALYPDAPPS